MKLHPDLRARRLNVYSTRRGGHGRVGERNSDEQGQRSAGGPMVATKARRDNVYGGQVPVPGTPQRVGIAHVFVS